jgi:DNA-binding PadR family transcriptional regulator
MARKCSGHTLLLLSTFVERHERWRYGYDLAQVTGLSSGTLYPILMRLCDRGWLDSRWQASTEAGRPPRHMYRLTSRGAALARAQLRAGAPGRTALAGAQA